MVSNWPTVTLEEVAKIKSGKRLPKGQSLVGYKTDYPYIRLVDIAGGRVQSDALQYLMPETRENIKRYIVNTDDICLAIVGHTIGMVFYVTEEWDNVNLTENAARITELDESFNPKFIYYFLSSTYGQSEIISRTVGSAQGKLPLYNIKSLPIPKPSKAYQDEIVDILDSISEKLELNKQTNQTLDQMAQALFKSWFVDFDPVIDNALAAGTNVSDFPEAMQQRAEQLKQAQQLQDFKLLPDDIRALFPNEFEQSELGWIPNGWESGTIDGVATALSGYAFKGKDFKGEGDAVIKIKNIKSDRSVDVGDVQRVSHDVSIAANRFHLNDGDLIMAMTGATVGKFGIVVSENDETLLLNQRVCKLSMKNSESNVFLFTLLSMQGLEESILNAAQGSAQPNISAKEILMTSLIIPPTELISHFNRFMSTSFQKMITLRKQNYELSKLRDTLLPKLISGELKLQE
jgi:type I restriction enzyme S subunit